MRRKRPKIKIILISFLFLLLLGTGYAYFETSLNINGYVTSTNNGFIIDKESNPYLVIRDYKVNSWIEKRDYNYQFSFKIKNTGTFTYGNFKATLTFNTSIRTISLLNYNYQLNKEVLIITKDNINLTPNSEIEVIFIITSKSNNLILNKIKLEANIINEEPNDKIIVTFIKDTSWGNYTIQYNVNVKNTGDKNINSWNIEVILDNATYVSGWNAKFEASNNILKISNDTYNGNINIGNTVTFGMQLNTASPDYIPSYYTVTTR